MKKTYKCLVCEDKVEFNEESNKFICTKCNAEYDLDIFNSKRKFNLKLKFRRYGLIFALLSAFYLLWLIYRIFIY